MSLVLTFLLQSQMQFCAVTHCMPSETLLSSFKHTGIILNLIRLFSPNADLGGRAGYGVGLRPPTDWDCGFEFPRGRECLSHVCVLYC